MKTILKNGNIITLNNKMPRVSAVLIEDGRIRDMGSDADIESRFTGAQLIDLKGRTAVPGFIDSHMHMLTAGLTKLQIDLTDACHRNIKSTLQYIYELTKDTDGWIRAFAFSEENLAEHRVLTRLDIDEIFPNRPVVITRICGHVSIINTKAMELLDICDDMVNPEGGEFMRDADGHLNGMAAEKAQQYILDHIPPYTREQMERAVRSEQEYLMRFGICSIHDAGTDQTGVEEYIDAYRQVEDGGNLKIRTYLMARPLKNKSFHELVSYVRDLKSQYGPESSRLFFGAVKLFADGSLGGKTAAVYDGYSGAPDNKGLLLAAELDKYVVKCHENWLQVCVHAIGDRAAGYVVDKMVEGITKDNNLNMRHRVEHCELCSYETMDKMASYGISAMMQPDFIRLFGSTYIKNIGSEKANASNRIKTMLSKGINIGFGTDYPVINPNPLLGIKAAVLRQAEGSKEVLGEKERVSVEESLRCYTMGSAFGSFTEHLQGSIDSGKFGDFAVLSGDITKVKTEEITEIETVMTIIGGEVMYMV